MDRRERRRRKRVEDKLRKKHERESPPAGWRLFNKTVSGTKLFYGLFAAVLALVGGYASLHPHVSMEPGITPIPGDPYSTLFVTTNDSSVFNIRNLKPSCFTVLIETDHGIRLSGLGSLQIGNVPVLGPREETTFACTRWFGGIGSGAGTVTKAYIDIEVVYKQDGWPFLRRQYFPLMGVVDSDKAVHWTHITASELQAASAQ